MNKNVLYIRGIIHMYNIINFIVFIININNYDNN